ncbi:DDT domain-containing protein PTM-like isoform X2 [Miscanthus floridulus]|uniref:DDT domain-containing protein PTM-like isoform X2 n=1 Tax=Miscanthus floridulus TaxID=154761 RepID=UPI003458E8FD
MEALVGRAVRKAFPGYGTFAGVVESYDPGAGYFRVLYEDGDSEEVDADGMAEILVGPAMPSALQQLQHTPPWDAAGRRPKKRRRGDGDGDEDDTSPTPTTNPSPDGVVLAVPAPASEDTEPATPAEEAAAEKKRRISPGPESSRPLRRSARQAKVAERAAEMEAAVAVAAAAEAEEEAAAAAVAAASTPQQSGRKRPRTTGSGRYRSVSRDLEEAAVKELPPKPELPPSSQCLDLGGLPVLDVFQVYSCLRSFSRQLFLSPFSLETFVAALRSTNVNPLIDWVHFALLRALKSHLEDFANEGDPSAVHCIRNLNWELLDLATWPIYLAEYLLTRGTELRYGMKLTDLSLLSTGYYRQPAGVKLELLRPLSDDVLEIGAIRSRLSESDGNDEGFRGTAVRRKKRGSSAKVAVDSSQFPEGSAEMDDGNSDECYLCGMDGNLLCCDGCPAAFHSKCVGVVEDLLPEGDWYCPECLIQKNDGSRNIANPMRGAEILGTDPHGRLYFFTCGYLLVADSCDGTSPCYYYGQIDLHPLVAVLNACHPLYSSMVNTISSFCGTAIKSSNLSSRYQSSRECSTSDTETDSKHLSLLKEPSEHDQFKVEQGNSFEHLDSGKACTSNSDDLDQDLSQDSIKLRSSLMSRSGNAAEENQKDSPPKEKPRDWQVHSDPARYINYYSFGQIAANAAEELKHKLSENKDGKKPVQDVLSFHLRTICKKYANIFALTDQKLSAELLKEKCGWCNSCQISGGVDCIFRVTDIKYMEGPKPHTIDLRAENNMDSHIILAMHNILSIEERLNGLLSGPWQNPQYSICWRKAVLKASDVSSLKQPLLTLESSLRRVAITAEWQKPADSVEVVGSAAHILVRSSNKSLSHGSARKPGRKPSPNGELKVDSRDVGVYWWRGGKLSREVFHWKRLPQSLVNKAARQAGRRKIPTILYTDGSQFARRFKYIAWRAAVEMAENAAQLILQIKELEWNIKWTEILSTLPSSLMTKETQKIARLFKKVIIRRKRIEGTNVEYLLDFGKRENIPPVISKHGTKLEEPSSERNRYWLSEGHVPLNLLKAYEAKTFARLLKKKETDELPKKTKKMRVPKPEMPRKTGFDYLFEKAEKRSTMFCGHCHKEVIASEAVNCQYCAAIFHRKHFKVPRGARNAVYVCNKCLDEMVLKVESPQKKAAPKKPSPKKKQKKQNKQKKQKKQSRKIETRRNQIVLKYKKKIGKKGKRGRPRKNPPDLSKNESSKILESEPSNVSKNEPVKRISKRLYDKYMKGNTNVSENAASSRKRKRTASQYSYWLNGLRWTQNPHDERAISFRKERVVFPSEDAEISEVSPVCCLCEKCYCEDDIYIACEKCEDWFHGDIFSVTIENVNNLIGFKCHRCRLRSLPVCPYAETVTILKGQSDKDHGIKFVDHSVDKFVEDEDPNCPKDLGALGILQELHDHDIERRLNGHITEIEFSYNNCLEELNDHGSLKEFDAHSTEKDPEDDKSLKKVDTNNELKELDDPGSEKEPGDHYCPKDLNSHINLKDLDNSRTDKEIKNDNCLNELDGDNNWKQFDAHSTEKDPDDDKSLKKVDTHNELKELDDPGCEKEPGDHFCPKDLNSDTNLKDLDNCRTDKEIKNNNCLNELDGNNNWKALDSHNSQEELGTTNSKFSPKEIQCPMELDGFSSLKVVDHNVLEELDNHNCLKESVNKNSSKELDNNESPKDSGDFLAEHFNNIRISGKEALVITPETDSVNESLGLQSKDDSGKTVPTGHEIDLQVVVTL